MASLRELQRDLSRAIEMNDLDRMASVRRTIVSGFSGTPEAAEALYKLGLDALFRGKNPQEATTLFRQCAQAKNAVWSPQARLSLGTLLLHQGKHQQATFEFRRIAGAAKPTLISAQGAGLVVIALRTAGRGQDADRARQQHLDILQKLTKDESGEVSSTAWFMLGMEHKHDGSRGPAKEALQAAVRSSELPEGYRSIAEKALQLL